MNTTDNAPANRSAWPLVIGLFVVVIIVIIAGIVLLTRGESEAPTAAPAAPGPAQQSTVDENAEGFSTPRSDSLGRKVDVPRNGRGVILPQATEAQKGFGEPGATTTPAEGIRWQQSAGTVIPFSTSDGPTRMDGQIPVGFAHTPAGAALAAASLTARLMDGQLGPETVTKRFNPESEKFEEMAQAAREMPAEVTLGDRVPRASGYEIGEDCDPSYCLVWLSMPGLDGVTRSTPALVVWIEDDWYLSDTSIPGREGTDQGLVRW